MKPTGRTMREVRVTAHLGCFADRLALVVHGNTVINCPQSVRLTFRDGALVHSDWPENHRLPFRYRETGGGHR